MSAIAPILRSRRTDKVLVDPATPLPVAQDHRQTVDTLLTDAAWAPFHYPSDKSHRIRLGSPVPWRFYKVDTPGCRTLMAELATNSRAGKITAMLAGADALIQVTWLPDAPADDTIDANTEFAGTQRNMEHIAAAASAAHGLILLATEGGYRTYWSSGGVLRDADSFQRLGIPTTEHLLGAVFLFPQDVGDAQIKPGAWRDKRGEITDWSVWCDI